MFFLKLLPKSQASNLACIQRLTEVLLGDQGSLWTPLLPFSFSLPQIVNIFLKGDCKYIWHPSFYSCPQGMDPQISWLLVMGLAFMSPTRLANKQKVFNGHRISPPPNFTNCRRSRKIPSPSFTLESPNYILFQLLCEGMTFLKNIFKKLFI